MRVRCEWGPRWRPVQGRSHTSGTKMRLTVTVEHLGGSLANLRGELTDWESGKRYATGMHVKTWRDLRPKSKL